MGVSIHGGSPKWMVCRENPIYDFGVPLFQETSVFEPFCWRQESVLQTNQFGLVMALLPAHRAMIRLTAGSFFSAGAKKKHHRHYPQLLVVARGHLMAINSNLGQSMVVDDTWCLIPAKLHPFAKSETDPAEILQEKTSRSIMQSWSGRQNAHGSWVRIYPLVQHQKKGDERHFYMGFPKEIPDAIHEIWDAMSDKMWNLAILTATIPFTQVGVV